MVFGCVYKFDGDVGCVCALMVFRCTCGCVGFNGGVCMCVCVRV